MADIKLFRLSEGTASELAGPEMALEKTLQTLIAKNPAMRMPASRRSARR